MQNNEVIYTTQHAMDLQEVQMRISTNGTNEKRKDKFQMDRHISRTEQNGIWGLYLAQPMLKESWLIYPLHLYRASCDTWI